MGAHIHALCYVCRWSRRQCSGMRCSVQEQTHEECDKLLHCKSGSCRLHGDTILLATNSGMGYYGDLVLGNCTLQNCFILSGKFGYSSSF